MFQALSILVVGQSFRSFRVTSCAFVALVMLSIPTISFAFKMGIHDEVTQDELEKIGFDRDSADLAADANFWTDWNELSNDYAHADNNELAGSSARLLNKLLKIFNRLEACEPAQALQELGRGLHTVQDIWSHTNAIDSGISVDIFNMRDGTAYCEDEGPFRPNALVSGYFELGTDQCEGKEDGECCHRFLNKDWKFSVNGARHESAKKAARAETRDFIETVEEYIRTRYAGDKERAEYLIQTLRKRQGNFYFVLDDTFSMREDIKHIRYALHNQLDAAVDGGEAPTLGFVTYKDSVSMRGPYCDIEKIRNLIDGLEAAEGDDCPEASNQALLAALGRFPLKESDTELRGGGIVHATDAAPKRPLLGLRVTATAKAKGVNIFNMIPSDCFPEDESAHIPITKYTAFGAQTSLASDSSPFPLGSDPLVSRSIRTQARAVARQTGGAMYWINHTRGGDMLPAIMEQGDPRTANIVTYRFQLAEGAERTVEIPIDETFKKHVRFIISLNKRRKLPPFIITRPDGENILLTDPDVQRQRYSLVDEYKIARPQKGIWRITIRDAGDYTVQAFGASDIRPNMMRFNDTVTPFPNEHFEVLPMRGAPTVGSLSEMDIRMVARPNITSIHIINLSGELLSSLIPSTKNNRYFRTTFAVPRQPFYVAAIGKTELGTDFRRQITTPVFPQYIGLAARPPAPRGNAGSRVGIQVAISNVSNIDASFTLTAESAQNWVVRAPAQVDLVSGGEQVVSIEVDIPHDAPPGLVDDLFVSVKHISSARSHNSIVLPLLVEDGNQPPNCNEASVVPDNLWPPNHKLVAVTIDNVTDPDGDMVAVNVETISQDEPTFGLGFGDKSPDAIFSESMVSLRSERSGSGDGRVYSVKFSATDDKGGECSGSVTVSVPHDHDGEAIDSGENFDSTVSE